MKILKKSVSTIYSKTDETGYIDIELKGKKYEIKYHYHTTQDDLFDDYDNDVELELPKEIEKDEVLKDEVEEEVTQYLYDNN